MFVNVDGGKIYCEISDFENLKDGRPILFVIAGGPGFDHGMYKNSPADFESFAHVVYHDARNCGKSSGFDLDSCTLEQHAKDIECIRKHFGFSKIAVLGTSYGSMVAMNYAINCSKYIENLVLVAGAPSHQFLDDAKKNVEEHGTAEQIDICKRYLWDGKFTTQDQVIEFLITMRPLYSKKVKANLALNPGEKIVMDVKVSFDVLNYAFANYFREFDLVPELSKISCQTLIMSGSEDWINDPRQALIMHEKIAGSILHVFDSGHSIAVDQPIEYARVIGKFLASDVIC